MWYGLKPLCLANSGIMWRWSPDHCLTAHESRAIGNQYALHMQSAHWQAISLMDLLVCLNLSYLHNYRLHKGFPPSKKVKLDIFSWFCCLQLPQALNFSFSLIRGYLSTNWLTLHKEGKTTCQKTGTGHLTGIWQRNAGARRFPTQSHADVVPRCVRQMISCDQPLRNSSDIFLSEIVDNGLACFVVCQWSCASSWSSIWTEQGKSSITTRVLKPVRKRLTLS